MSEDWSPPPAQVWRECETKSLVSPELVKALQKKNKKNMEAAYGDGGLSSSQIYRMIKQAKARKNTDDQ